MVWKARLIGSDGDYEEVIDSDYPTNEDGSRAGPEDTFRLEYSGWNMGHSLEWHKAEATP